MNIVLTGFMGTGKSEVGKLLAHKLGWQWFDTDAVIEKEIRMTIPQIFELKGEPYFRKLEKQTVRLFSLLDKAVISCGGGIVMDAENMAELEKNGIVVCLTATPDKILERTRNSGRPLLAVSDPEARIRELLEERKKHYGRCTTTIDTTHIPLNQVPDVILKHPAVAGKI